MGSTEPSSPLEAKPATTERYRDDRARRSVSAALEGLRYWSTSRIPQTGISAMFEVRWRHSSGGIYSMSNDDGSARDGKMRSCRQHACPEREGR